MPEPMKDWDRRNRIHALGPSPASISPVTPKLLADFLRNFH